MPNLDAYLPDTEAILFEDDGAIPNSSLPALIYHEVAAAAEPEMCEELFARNGWLGAWRDGIFDFHHFHSTSHEVLGIVAGSAEVVLGGPAGQHFQVERGDVLALPAGTGHCNAGSRQLLVVGAYPDGRSWDLRRGDPAEHDQALASIRAVPLPDADPVYGASGPLTELWVS
ncbi:MAG: hypothetical protein JO169_04015 [Solirubrobacterales bacterium]|nr:hypothetical protein [Solirubrobacterales bacterium]